MVKIVFSYNRLKNALRIRNMSKVSIIGCTPLKSENLAFSDSLSVRVLCLSELDGWSPSSPSSIPMNNLKFITLYTFKYNFCRETQFGGLHFPQLLKMTFEYQNLQQCDTIYMFDFAKMDRDLYKFHILYVFILRYIESHVFRVLPYTLCYRKRSLIPLI